MPRARRRALGAPALSSGLALGLPQRHRADPARGARREGGAGRLAPLLAGRVEPRGEAALELTLGLAGAVVAINAVTGTALAWTLVRDEFPGQAVRERADRPAVRAADDRRRPDAARALRAEQRRARQRRVHALGRADGAPLRDAAVRRAHGAAGADRARPRDGGGGGVARREPAARSSGASSSRTCCRRSSRASRSRSRARSASSARSILIAGNLPFKTEVASLYVFQRLNSGDTTGAAALAVLLLVISLAVLLGIGGVRRWATRHDR